MRRALLTAILLAASILVSAQSAYPPLKTFTGIPGVRLAYIDTGGSGTAVVLMHAASGNALLWEKQIPALTGAGFRVIAYDRRNTGSTRVEPGTPAASAASDLLALMTSLGIDRFHLIGTAAGGGTTFEIALSSPDRLRSIVVSNSIGVNNDAEYTEIGRRLRPTEFESWPVDFKELGPSYRAVNPEGTKRWLELVALSRPAGAPEAGRRGGGPAPPAPGAAAGRGGAPAGGRGGGGGVTFERLGALKVPVLVMTGDADLYLPPSVLRMFAMRMPQAETRVITEAGHSSFWEQPDQFNNAVLTFIRKH